MQTLSIITPSFNQGEFIERTIVSVIQQNIANLEYVVIDGGSTDETINILKKYEHQLQWVSEPDNGQTDAVNKGINKTSGEIIGWLNSDDIYYPGTLQYILDFFQNNPKIEVLYGDADHIDKQDNAFEAYYSEPWNLQRLFEVCYICQPTVFFRRSVFEKYGLLTTKLQYCMDYEFWVRLGLAGVKFAKVDKLLAGSRLYQDNKTLGSRLKVHQEINDMLKEKLGKVPNRWLSNYAHVLMDVKTKVSRDSWIFPYAVSVIMVYTAIKWNRSLDKSLLKMSLNWIKQ